MNGSRARSPKAGRPRKTVPLSPFAKRRQPTATAAVRRDTTLLQRDAGRRVESRMAPPRYTERRRARPGAGTKRSRAAMSRPEGRRGAPA